VTHRQRFFAVLENRPADRVPFFPDITDWYKARRTPPGEPQRYATGQLIFDDDPFHQSQVDMPARFRDFTLLDFYRHFDWGCPIHAYEALSSHYDGATRSEVEGGLEHRYYGTPHGTLHTTMGLAADGSRAFVRHPVQRGEDVPALEYWARATHHVGHPDAAQRILEALGEGGAMDISIGRTPFGLLIQELMGYETVAFTLADDPQIIHRLMECLEEGWWQRVDLACALPGRLAIISDHADEYLISPRWFRDYCLPYYREAARRLHAAGKFVSTHLDGHIRNLLPLLPDSGFDLLDGCTPAPMGNYEVEDLAALLGLQLKAYCGVPSTLFCTHTPTEEILAYGRRITALAPNVILNVGDVLPPDGDIEQVVALGRMCGAGSRSLPRGRSRGDPAARVIAIKPHHFVDIIADYGLGQIASGPHPYHHDLSRVTAAVLGDPGVMLQMEFGADDICKPCVHNINGLCDDPLDPWHGPLAPALKRDLNLLLDQRWSERLGLSEGDRLTARELCQRLRARKGDIRDIYRQLPASFGEEKARALELGLAKYLRATGVP